MEWDEESHYFPSERKKDEERDLLIKKALNDPEWIFLRIREKDYIDLNYEQKKHYIQEVIDRRNSAE